MRFATLLIISCILPVLALMFDISDRGTGVGESSATEFLQSIALFLTVMCLLLCARRNEVLRPAAMLMAGLAALAFIREQDTYFDNLYHGAWVPFAFILVVILTIYCIRNFAEIRTGLGFIMVSRSLPVLTLGAAFVLVQSRLFGTNRLWRQILELEQSYLVKTIVQEGLELTGYLIILVATFEFMKASRNALG